jgi:hypothetical protein
MTIKDPVYSSFTISSPLALELIATPAFQRLREINQFGIPAAYYHLCGYSRYEHSIGVYILLHHLDASEDEQIAGLLHDISHTAFSHLIDWVIGDSEKEDYQDKRHLTVLKQPEIAGILQRYQLEPEDIADYHRFALLEKDAPDLCADRIDYALRESDPQIARTCLPHLKAFAGEIVFTDKAAALIFARNFLQKQIEHWGGYEATTRYRLLAQILRQALQAGDISIEDFSLTDAHVISQLQRTNKKEYLEVLELLTKKNLDFLPRSQTVTKKKFRHVDPKVLIDSAVRPLSALDQNFKAALQQAKEENDRGIYAGILA